MMPTFSANKSDPQMIERQQFLPVLQAAFDSKLFQFIRTAAMAWLASYPGDMEVNLLLVKALIAESRESMALPILEKILRNDIEYADALKVAESVFIKSDAAKAQSAGGSLQALGLAPGNGLNLPDWGVKLFMARQAIQTNDLTSAQALLMEVITSGNVPSLAGEIHLQLVEKQNDLTARLNLGRVYHSRWPDCIQISLLLAKTWMESGDQDEAVNLLHECEALDPAGQVPTRLWGAQFDFKAIYPTKMEIVESFAIPGEVAAKFGLNHLAGGAGSTSGGQTNAQRSEVHSFDGYRVRPNQKQSYPEHPRQQQHPKHKDPVVQEVEQQLQQIADNLKTPSSARADSRFPAYVILTTHSGLTTQYGQQSAEVILSELGTLANSIQGSKKWHSFVFLPDDLTVCGKFGITPVDAIDPWKIKLALTDLDAALAKTGEMIGCVLIVGGEKVVPFHGLPNPTDDADVTVPSDSPYGSLDKNYFVGDWPVGRLPGDAGEDSGLLLTQIRNLEQYHEDDTANQGWLNQLIHFLVFWSQAYTKNFCNLGYTAAIWQRSSLAAFRPIGEGRNLFLSPVKTASFNAGKLAQAPFGYFNLHGVEDGSDWYGQKDVSDTSAGDDYPVALKPSDLVRNTNSPRIVFSEACYGGHISGRTEDGSIALTFLGQGVLGMIASTTIAYGSVTTPLIGADLLANLVMKYLVEGQPVGTAFMKARVDFVREMNLRQGYLDGEDQKTLISFVLYGDPLVCYDPYGISSSKTIIREQDHPVVKTVVDQEIDEAKSSPISAKAIANAKDLAKQYLPGIEYAEVHIRRQHVNLPANAQQNLGAPVKSVQVRPANHLVVSFSKQVNFDKHIHHQYARVTLDQQGKVVKLAISR